MKDRLGLWILEMESGHKTKLCDCMFLLEGYPQKHSMIHYMDKDNLEILTLEHYHDDPENVKCGIGGHKKSSIKRDD